MKKTILLVLGIGLNALAWAQQAPIKKEKFHFGAPTQQDTAAGYTQAVKVDNLIYVSGTVALDITPEGISFAYRNIEKTLAHYGATMQHVVKENLYTTDIEAMAAYNAARKAFYKGDYPAATWVQISRLFMKEAKLEIEVIAYLPK
ncbi:RidA family protein [Flavihumibacter rivuli]|uniref:RidA family protein n=1 Tax=Flavihumibacter rivuli TaxID=2838156 RepID=UPI001BDF064D|nr:RidA family protein [Flavihumibacter rivuli]ULQ55917.1 RidA family protein [Flavihumibacter rivuli]